MSILSTEQKRIFLISILRKNALLRRKTNITFEEIYQYWYESPRFNDHYDACVGIAFTTIMRSLRGLAKNPNHDIIINDSKRYLIDRLKNLDVKTQNEFDNWHRETIDSLIEIFTKNHQKLSLLQAQEWLNMTIKHLSIAEEDTVQKYYAFCHVPIDKILLAKYTEKAALTNYDEYLKFQQAFRDSHDETPLDADSKIWLSKQ